MSDSRVTLQLSAPLQEMKIVEGDDLKLQIGDRVILTSSKVDGVRIRLQEIEYKYNRKFLANVPEFFGSEKPIILYEGQLQILQKVADLIRDTFYDYSSEFELESGAVKTDNENIIRLIRDFVQIGKEACSRKGEFIKWFCHALYVIGTVLHLITKNEFHKYQHLYAYKRRENEKIFLGEMIRAFGLDYSQFELADEDFSSWMHGSLELQPATLVEISSLRKNLDRELASIVKEVDSAKLVLSSQIEIAQSEHDKIAQEKYIYETRHAAKERKLQNKKDDLKELDFSIRGTNSSIGSLDMQVVALKQQIDLRKTVEGLDEEISILGKEIKDLKEAIALAEAKKIKFSDPIEGIDDEIEEMTQLYDKMQTDLEEMRKKEAEAEKYMQETATFIMCGANRKIAEMDEKSYLYQDFSRCAGILRKYYAEKYSKKEKDISDEFIEMARKEQLSRYKQNKEVAKKIIDEEQEKIRKFCDFKALEGMKISLERTESKLRYLVTLKQLSAEISGNKVLLKDKEAKLSLLESQLWIRKNIDEKVVKIERLHGYCGFSMGKMRTIELEIQTLEEELSSGEEYQRGLESFERQLATKKRSITQLQGQLSRLSQLTEFSSDVAYYLKQENLVKLSQRVRSSSLKGFPVFKPKGLEV
jgi:hypothetical protein